MSGSSFTHSPARVPRLYKEAGRIVEKVKLEGGSFKGLVYQSKHKCTKSLYALVAETLRHSSELDLLLRRTNILHKESRLNPWLARVLITEMLWRQRCLSGPSVPLKIVESYKAQLLSEQTALANEKFTPGKKDVRPRFVRVNTLKTTTDFIRTSFTCMGWKEVWVKSSIHQDDQHQYSSFLQRVNSLAEDEFIQDLHVPDLLIFPRSLKFYELEEYHNSSLILQDKASCLSAYFLEAPSGSAVLDMCAAPGMKTSHAAALLKDHGIVYAIEKHSGRYESLCKIVANSGAKCVKPIHGDALKYSYLELPNVEYIIVDPSCSGSGMCDREDIFNDSSDVSKDRLQKLSGFQCALLRHAMTRFPQAKRIVYSTCSVFPEENEAVIEAALNSSPPNFVPVQLSKGLTWMKQGSSSYQCGSYGLYTQAETDLTNGFFIAVFERSHSEYVISENLITRDVPSKPLNPTIKSNKKRAKKSKKRELLHINSPEDTETEAFEKLKKAMLVLCAASDPKQVAGSGICSTQDEGCQEPPNWTDGDCENKITSGDLSNNLKCQDAGEKNRKKVKQKETFENSLQTCDGPYRKKKKLGKLVSVDGEKSKDGLLRGMSLTEVEEKCNLKKQKNKRLHSQS